MTDKSAIIVKPSTAQAFETLWKRGRYRLCAASLEDAWDILLIDNIQDMQEDQDWQALCALIRESTDRRFLLLSRGIPPACLMAFQYQKRMRRGASR